MLDTDFYYILANISGTARISIHSAYKILSFRNSSGSRFLYQFWKNVPSKNCIMTQPYCGRPSSKFTTRAFFSAVNIQNQFVLIRQIKTLKNVLVQLWGDPQSRYATSQINKYVTNRFLKLQSYHSRTYLNSQRYGTLDNHN